MKDVDSWPVESEHKVIAGTFRKQPVEEGDSVVSDQETMVRSQDVCPEARGSTLQSPTGPGFEIVVPMTLPKGTDYSVPTAAATTQHRQDVPSVYAGTLGGICIEYTATFTTRSRYFS